MLSRDPLALLIGMVLDQQVHHREGLLLAGRAAAAARRHGPLDAAAIAAMDPDELAAVFQERPALHRYPGSMAGRVQAVCRVVAEEYGEQGRRHLEGRARAARSCWTACAPCPGFGEQKARIFAALLGKQLGVRPEGWREATTPYGEEGTLPVGGRHHRPREPGQGPGDQEGDEGQGAARRGVTAGRRPRRAAASTSARRTGPTWPRSSATASPAGWTSSSCATRSSRPGRCWPGPRVAAAVCRDHGVPFVLNDRPDLALEVGADGVHVGQDDAPVSLARRILGPDAIVGLSTHGPADLDGAAAEEVTYISAGPVEATPTKPGRPGTGTGLRHSGQRTLQCSRLRDRRRDPGDDPRSGGCRGPPFRRRALPDRRAATPGARHGRCAMRSIERRVARRLRHDLARRARRCRPPGRTAAPSAGRPTRSTSTDT